jgi:hypothetical protein
MIIRDTSSNRRRNPHHRRVVTETTHFAYIAVRPHHRPGGQAWIHYGCYLINSAR